MACGLIGWSRRPKSRIGLITALTRFAWFLGTLAGSDIDRREPPREETDQTSRQEGRTGHQEGGAGQEEEVGRQSVWS
jgi:hypothetical protein